MTNKKNILYGFLVTAFLWLCIWATYDTDVSRMSIAGFPHSLLDLVHGIRSLFPFVAIIISIIILLKNRSLSRKIFKTPIGLLGIFTLVGIFASIFSVNPLMAFYWGVMYGSVLSVLLTIIDNKELLKTIIKINLIIAGMLALGLTALFFIQPGAAKSLTLNFLVCMQRPYEGLGGVAVAMDTFDVAGTRPTGLGRYAGFVAIFSFASLLFSEKKNKMMWSSAFLVSVLILLFSKGKTEVAAFVAAMIFAIWIAKKINIYNFLLAGVICLMSFFIIFYNIPCTNSVSISTPKIFMGSDSNQIVASSEDPVNRTEARSIKSIATLSGRTSGVWTDSLHLFLKNPFFGFGFQADRYFLNGQHAHNSLIHALVQAGILGTIPFVLAFFLTFIILVRLLKNSKLETKERRFLIVISAVLVFFAIRSITESVAFFSADWLFIAPIIAYIQCLDSQVKVEINGESKVSFLGNKINTIKNSGAVAKINYWIKNESQRLHWVIVTGMHGIVEAEKRVSFKYIISNANMWVPDGMSLVWLATLKGFDIKERVSGADLMSAFFKDAEKKGFSSYFYGDTEETLQALNKKLLLDFPSLKIAGSYSPPFRELTAEEDEEIIKKINLARADVLWIALGLPKQEKWIFKHRDELKVPVVIGVGAAFKFLSGRVERAPAWIGKIGLEWLWRLFKEPKVTWRRVFIDMPIFFMLVVKDFLFENK